MNRVILMLSFAGVLVCGPTVVHASPITFNFAGEVSQDPLLDPNDPFAGSIAFGTAFSGFYTFESTTSDSDPSANGGSYTSAGGTFSVTIGGNNFMAADLLNIGMGNNFSGSDFYTVFAQNTSGADPFDVGLTLQDLQATVFGGALLATDAPSFAAFELATLFLSGTIAGNQVQIDGRLTSLTCTSGCEPGGGAGVPRPVPEPATVALLSTGLVAMGLRRRRTRQ
jgi:PEP-CTERM motif-containing protein